MFRTITAKFPGICKRCDQPFPKGMKVRYNGHGCYHLKAECSAGDIVEGILTDGLEVR